MKGAKSTYLRVGEYAKGRGEKGPRAVGHDRGAAQHFRKGSASYVQGEYGRAIEEYTKAVDCEPDFTMSFYKRGNAYCKVGEYDRAIADFSKVIDLTPDDARAYNNRGIAYIKKGERDRAIADYEKAIDLDPDYDRALKNLKSVKGGAERSDEIFTTDAGDYGNIFLGAAPEEEAAPERTGIVEEGVEKMSSGQAPVVEKPRAEAREGAPGGQYKSRSLGESDEPLTTDGSDYGNISLGAVPEEEAAPDRTGIAEEGALEKPESVTADAGRSDGHLLTEDSDYGIVSEHAVPEKTEIVGERALENPKSVTADAGRSDGHLLTGESDYGIISEHAVPEEEAAPEKSGIVEEGVEEMSAGKARVEEESRGEAREGAPEEKEKSRNMKKSDAGSGGQAPPPDSAAVREMNAATQVRNATIVFSIIVTALLLLGWRVSMTDYLVPEEGLGYALGIVGASMMVLLLLYPLRKTARFMRNWFAIKHWFRLHMIFGVLGPLLIIYHSNYSLGSLNSRVALVTTLVVAVSGVIGRFFYTRIHYGLYGEQMTLMSLQRDVAESRSSMLFELDYAPKLKERLLSFEATVLKPHHGLIRSVWYIVTTGFWARWTRLMLNFGLKRAIRITARRAGWPSREKKKHRRDARTIIARHIRSVIRISYLGFYVKLMGYWHIFHFPLFLLLIIVAVVHILAVHMY